MALALSQLWSGSTGTTGTVTPAARSRVFLTIMHADSDGSVVDPSVGDLSGTGWAAGATWTKHVPTGTGAHTHTNSDGSEARLSLFSTLVGASPSAGTVTLTAPGTDFWLGRLTQVTAGAGLVPSVVQTRFDELTATASPQPALATAPAGTSTLYAEMLQFANTAATLTPGAGFTRLGSDADLFNVLFLMGQYDSDAPGDGEVDASSTVSAAWLTVATELEEIMDPGGGGSAKLPLILRHLL